MIAMRISITDVALTRYQYRTVVDRGMNKMLRINARLILR